MSVLGPTEIIAELLRTFVNQSQSYVIGVNLTSDCSSIAHLKQLNGIKQIQYFKVSFNYVIGSPPLIDLHEYCAPAVQ